MNEKITVLLVDDHTIFIEGLKLVLSKSDRIRVVGTCNNGIEMLDFLAHSKPDIVVLDINMPRMDGEEAINQALERYPDIKILVLSSQEDDPKVQRILLSGIKGFIGKTSCQKELVTAITAIANGEIHFSHQLFNLMVDSLKRKDTLLPVREPQCSFTPRELDVIRRLCMGETNKEVAESLGINVRTVETHKAHILEKAGVKNTLNLVIYVMKNNIISI